MICHLYLKIKDFVVKGLIENDPGTRNYNSKCIHPGPSPFPCLYPDRERRKRLFAEYRRKTCHRRRVRNAQKYEIPAKSKLRRLAEFDERGAQQARLTIAETKRA